MIFSEMGSLVYIREPQSAQNKHIIQWPWNRQSIMIMKHICSPINLTNHTTVFALCLQTSDRNHVLMHFARSGWPWRLSEARISSCICLSPPAIHSPNRWRESRILSSTTRTTCPTRPVRATTYVVPTHVDWASNRSKKRYRKSFYFAYRLQSRSPCPRMCMCSVPSG